MVTTVQTPVRFTSRTAINHSTKKTPGQNDQEFFNTLL